MQFLTSMLPYTMLASSLLPSALALPQFDLPTISPQGIADSVGGTLLQGQDDILNPAEGTTTAVQGYTSGCVQIWCEVSLCATDGMDSWSVASEQLQHLMGRDCGGWGADPENKGQETCSDGKELYEGTFKIYRAHVGTEWWANYGNATSDALQAAKCTAHQKVKCKGKGGYCPVNGSKGQCTSEC